MKTKFINVWADSRFFDSLYDLWGVVHYEWGLGESRAINPLDINHYDRFDLALTGEFWIPESVLYNASQGFSLDEVRDEIGRMRFPCWHYNASHYPEHIKYNQ